MVVEIYLLRFIIFCILAFAFGYFVVYQTLTKAEHKKGFDTFHFFESVGIPTLFETIWTLVVKIIKFITGGLIELEEFKAKK